MNESDIRYGTVLRDPSHGTVIMVVSKFDGLYDIIYLFDPEGSGFGIRGHWNNIVLGSNFYSEVVEEPE
jgi:hypothetical protein